MRRAEAVIDLSAVEANTALVRRTLSPAVRLCAVVKADAYGHGSVPVAEAALASGADRLAVATVAEARELRDALSGVPIQILGPLTRAELADAIDARAQITVGSRHELDSLGALKPTSPVAVHVKLDSGMSRWGATSPQSALDLCRAAAESPHARLLGVMTHFATSDAVDGHYQRQLKQFRRFAYEAKSLFPGILAHAANSAATFNDPSAHFDMVRCGVALYGLDPAQGDARELGLAPAMELRSYVARLARLDEGDSVGYGRGFVARRPMRVATIPIGYADGVSRASDGIAVLIGGRRYPICGRVSMDSMTVAISSTDHVRLGDTVTLVGRQGESRITTEEIGAALGTINYEVVCSVGSRVPRRYSKSGCVPDEAGHAAASGA